jgi:hypothetical protein
LQVVVTYKGADGQPGVAQLSIQLPMCLFCQVRLTAVGPWHHRSLHVLTTIESCIMSYRPSALNVPHVHHVVAEVQVVPPGKTTDYKLTVSTNREAVQMMDLFTDMVAQVGATQARSRAQPAHQS